MIFRTVCTSATLAMTSAALGGVNQAELRGSGVIALTSTDELNGTDLDVGMAFSFTILYDLTIPNAGGPTSGNYQNSVLSTSVTFGDGGSVQSTGGNAALTNTGSRDQFFSTALVDPGASVMGDFGSLDFDDLDLELVDFDASAFNSISFSEAMLQRNFNEFLSSGDRRWFVFELRRGGSLEVARGEIDTLTVTRIPAPGVGAWIVGLGMFGIRRRR